MTAATQELFEQFYEAHGKPNDVEKDLLERVGYVNGDTIDQWCKQKRTSSTMMYTDWQGSSRSKAFSTACCQGDAVKGSPSDVEDSSVCCSYQSSRTREGKAQEIYAPSLDRIQDSMNGGNLLGRSDAYEGYIY